MFLKNPQNVFLPQPPFVHFENPFHTIATLALFNCSTFQTNVSIETVIDLHVSSQTKIIRHIAKQISHNKNNLLMRPSKCKLFQGKLSSTNFVWPLTFDLSCTRLEWDNPIVSSCHLR